MIDTTFDNSPETTTASDPPLPEYMTEIYEWAYVSPRWVRFLDRNIVVKTLLFGNDERLIRAYIERIKPGMCVWQVAHVYGDLVRQAAERCAPIGHFTLTDVTPIQLQQARKKLQGMAWANIQHADAGYYNVGESCDLICSFFLLHEVPDGLKRRIVDNMLNQLPQHGEALFIDYHRPAWWHPVRYVLKWVNHYLEPFAEALWHKEIEDFATYSERFEWIKRTVFGGTYQIVQVRHRTSEI